MPGLHFFSVEFDRIVVPEKFVDAEIYNIHFSLLPRYKGVYTSVWPILNGDTETGVTLHRMNSGIDTGPLIHQVIIPIDINDTSRTIYHACLKVGYDVLRSYIPKLVASPMNGVAQAMTGSTYYGPKSIDYANLAIDLRQTAFQVHNAVRAFSFQEYQLPSILGRRVRASCPTSCVSQAKPGTVVDEDADSFTLSTIDFNLHLTKDYSLELMHAVEQDNTARVLALTPHVPNLEIRNRRGWSPLMIAAYANDLPVVMTLLDAGADINAINKKGTSVLMYAKSAAIRTKDLEVMQYLLSQGADHTITDVTGKSVLDYARLEGNQNVIKCLEGWTDS